MSRAHRICSTSAVDLRHCQLPRLYARSNAAIRTYGAFRANALDDDPDGVREADRVVRGVRWAEMSHPEGLTGLRRTRKQEHLALFDPDVLELVSVDDPE